MKSYLASQKVKYDHINERSELEQLVKETRAKQAEREGQQAQSHAAAAANPASATKSCDCMQGGSSHSHVSSSAAAASAAASSAAASAAKPGGALVRSIPVGPLQCNCTIIADPVSREGLLIDPGGDPDRIIALVKEMDVRIVQILVTHGHFDHFLAATEIRKHTGAKLALHPGDNMLFAALSIQCAMIGLPAPAQPVAPPDSELSDGLSLPIRGGKVLHTPGHSPGSCCFYFAEDNLVCTGDTLFAGSVGRTDLMGGDSNALVRSIQSKLYSLPADTKAIPGHGPSTTIGHEAKFNAVVKAASQSAL